MGYIGNRPTAVPLTSADIQDSIITSAKILDGTIVNADVNASAAIASSKLDTTDLRTDIMTLALKEAITENRVAYNLPNAMIEQFQDDSKIGTETDGDRNASEYWDTATGAPTAAYSSDSNTKLLLHFDGSDDGTTFTDSGNSSHTMTRVGSTVTKTGQKKFGTASGYFDGVGDWLTVPDHADWFLGTSDFTIDFWLYPTDFDHHAHDQSTVYCQSASGSDAQAIHIDDTGMLRFWDYDSGYNLAVNTAAGAVTLNSWQHFAFIRDYSANTGQWYKDGAAITSTKTSGEYNGTIHNVSAILSIGDTGYDTGNRTFKGYMDEFRYSNSVRTIASANATGTLISTAQTANSAQTKVSGVILYKNQSGTATLGTDLKIYFTCNGGTNWTESTPTAAGTFSSGILMAKCPEVTCTSGTDIRYKAVWANQSSGSKETQLHGIGMNY